MDPQLRPEGLGRNQQNYTGLQAAQVVRPGADLVSADAVVQGISFNWDEVKNSPFGQLTERTTMDLLEHGWISAEHPTAKKVREYTCACVLELFSMINVTPGSDAECLRGGRNNNPALGRLDDQFSSFTDSMFAFSANYAHRDVMVPSVSKEQLIGFFQLGNMF